MFYAILFFLLSIFCVQMQAAIPDSEKVTSAYVATPAQFGWGMFKGSFNPFLDVASLIGESTTELQKLFKGIMASPLLREIIAPHLINETAFYAGNQIGYFFVLCLLLRSMLTSSVNTAMPGSVLLGLGIKGLVWASANKEFLKQKLDEAKATIAL